MTALSFLVFLGGFLAVGVMSITRARDDADDYYLASRELSPLMTGLSAVATNNSGYMFIGVIGYTYATGLAAIWLMVGWILGDLLGSLLLHRHLREASGRAGAATLPGTLAGWQGQHMGGLRAAGGLIAVVFMGAYAAAQLAAGGKALTALFGWHPDAGALIGSGIVLLYCFAGGIRASIWTDTAQAIVMLAAMTLLFGVGVHTLGGPGATWTRLAAIDGYTDLVPPALLLPGAAGLALFIIGWLFAGLGVLGQPHIVVRFMALEQPSQMMRARFYYYVFFSLFYALATGVGMLARLYLPELAAGDPELALPTMARELLPPVLVGLILAGIFAATLSTADSLVLACSASVTTDLLPGRQQSRRTAKLATIAVTGLALLLAVAEPPSVFALVILAWSALASAFVPLAVLLALGQRPAQWQAIAIMLGGLAASLGWYAVGLNALLYEGLIGLLTGLALWPLSEWWRRRTVAVEAA
ncbi:MAG: sodium/proline symporter [Pseudomonadota bacterium]|nr:sodium/proline symporter [Pseudomonadota bacterium]